MARGCRHAVLKILFNSVRQKANAKLRALSQSAALHTGSGTALMIFLNVHATSVLVHVQPYSLI